MSEPSFLAPQTKQLSCLNVLAPQTLGKSSFFLLRFDRGPEERTSVGSAECGTLGSKDTISALFTKVQFEIGVR